MHDLDKETVIGATTENFKKALATMDQKCREYTDAERAQSRAERELEEAKQKLGKALVPEKAAVGERFGFWIGATCWMCSRKEDGTYIVAVR